MQFHTCPYCSVASNRKYNIVRHIYRKHPGNYIPDNMFPLTKNGKYSCPYCLSTSNRKYNMKEHIERKHAGAKIPDDIFYKKIFKNSTLISNTSSINFPSWLNYQNYIDPLSPPHDLDNKKENTNNSFLKTILEFLKYRNIIQTDTIFQNPHFYQNNNWFNLNSQSVYYDHLSNIGFGEPFLFKIYKCSICFRDTPVMVSALDSIRTSTEHRCNFNCNLLATANEENKNTIDPEVLKFSINKIFEIIDKKRNPKLKLCLRSIKIPKNFHLQLILNQIQFQFQYNEQDSETTKENVPSWLQKLLVNEKFIDLENIDENDWANRLMTSNNNTTEITREELVRFINLSNSTFGLFKFQKDHNIISYLFFSYLQLEKDFE
jgi:hypothetical protein